MSFNFDLLKYKGWKKSNSNHKCMDWAGKHKSILNK